MAFARPIGPRNDDRDIHPTAWRGPPSKGINWNTALIATAIALTILAPITAAAATGRIPLSNARIIEDTKPSNGTCAPTSTYWPLSNALQEYVYHGRMHHIQPSFKNTFIFISEEQLGKNLNELAQLLHDAELQEHPLDRALCFHQVGSQLRQALLSQYREEGIAISETREKVSHALVEEIKAIQEASRAAPTARAEINLIRRGLEELNLLAPNFDVPDLCSFDTDEEVCLSAASLWKQASEVFLRFPNLEPRDCLRLIPDSDRAFQVPLYASARSLRNAAFCMGRGNDTNTRETRLNYIVQAIQQQQRIDTEHWSLHDQAKLQEEIADTCASAWNIVRDTPQAEPYAERVLKETLAAYTYYWSLGLESSEHRAYAYVKAAKQLLYAGNFSSDLKDKLSYYIQAKKFTDRAWSANDVVCRNMRDFNLDNTYQGDLRDFINLRINYVKRAISEEDRSLESIWRRIFG